VKVEVPVPVPYEVIKKETIEVPVRVEVPVPVPVEVIKEVKVPEYITKIEKVVEPAPPVPVIVKTIHDT